MSSHASTSPVVDVVQDAEDAQEKVQEVEIERNGTHNVLVRRQLLVDEEGVKDDVSRKDETSSGGVNEVHGAVEGNEDADESGGDKGQEATKQEWCHSRKVVLRLEREERQAEEYNDSDEKGLKDDSGLVKGDNYANRERFHECESREEDEIGGEAMTLPEKEPQGNEASKRGKVEDPYVRLDPGDCTGALRQNAADESGTEDLNK